MFRRLLDWIKTRGYETQHIEMLEERIAEVQDKSDNELVFPGRDDDREAARFVSVLVQIDEQHLDVLLSAIEETWGTRSLTALATERDPIRAAELRGMITAAMAVRPFIENIKKAVFEMADGQKEEAV